MPEWVQSLMGLYGPFAIAGWFVAWKLWSRNMLLEDRQTEAHAKTLEMAAQNAKSIDAIREHLELLRPTVPKGPG